MSFLESKSSGSDEPFVFRGFTGEVVADEGDFVDEALPGLLLALTGSEDLEHFVLRHGLDLLNGHFPLAGLLLSLLLNHIAQHLSPVHFVPVQQIGGDGSVFLLLFLGEGRFLLLVGLDVLLHLYLLLVPLLRVELTLYSVQSLRLLRCVFNFSRLLLPFPLPGIETLSEALLIQLHVVVLWLKG